MLIGTPNHGSELADLGEGYPVSLASRAGPSGRALGTGPEAFPASLPPPDYPVGIIAGTRSNALTDRWLPQPNDGMVSLASAELEDMAAMVTVDESHTGLRNSAVVADLVSQFLRYGRFEP